MKAGPRWLAALSIGVVWACAGGEAKETARAATGGDPDRGGAAIRRYGCGACHVIPGVRAARGSVGPPLDGFASRVYLAGKFPNQPDHLLSWLRDPPAMAPQTAMPALVEEQSARDIAAYLYTLE